ncbi:hypothetical protein Asp14428_39880 [Actinoplanes sp. NBRC 14428]|uniref:Uncharacterized protein n=1 Tax=Pseudosporangium ferrugineum TaxID=439699 RepID=A0A2T0RMB5_9ACTN|nr:hypothetical protein [Pseudosporangium ferrugineum]PRY22336.1 hypothetical protein CLV70_11739 [Pseudosporangium ferrugineum]BCJ52513.1 hypothetical protein Asp14428_39880 [Actinoplanes sp. NBRC 14428]
MTYGIYFDGSVSADAIRQALHAVYNVPADLVYAGPPEALNDHPGPDPVALITPAGGQFAHEFSAGDGLRELTGATELELAQGICRVARTRALLDDGSPAPDYWLLVASDGSYGRVQTDPDSDELTVLYALEPIIGEPGLRVVPPPDWAKTW